MTVTIDGTSGINTPGVVNTAAETIATTLAVTGVTTFAAGTAALPAITTTGDTNTGIFFPAADTIAFSEGGAEAMRIDSSGNLLVGKITANTPPSVGHEILSTGFGTTTFTLATTNECYIYNNTSTAGTAIIDFRVANIGKGSIQFTNTSTTYNTTSDYRLKEAIAPMTGALAKIAALKPCTYKWKIDGSDGQGFIAHELQEVVEGCVTGKKDAMRTEQYEVTPAVKDEEGNTVTEAVMGEREVPYYQGIDTSFLIATLSAAIQELHALVKTQDSTITALTTRIIALEAA